MATTAQEWQQSDDGSSEAHPEPVITYDHMSDSEPPLYFSTTNKITAMPSGRLLIDGLLMAIMLAALVTLAF